MLMPVEWMCTSLPTWAHEEMNRGWWMVPWLRDGPWCPVIVSDWRGGNLCNLPGLNIPCLLTSATNGDLPFLERIYRWPVSSWPVRYPWKVAKSVSVPILDQAGLRSWSHVFLIRTFVPLLHMSQRDTNRGGYIQSCRWKYDHYDAILARTQSIQRTSPGRIFYVSRGHVYDRKYSRTWLTMGLIAWRRWRPDEICPLRIDSSQLLQGACDAYMEDPEAFSLGMIWSMNCGRLLNIELATGFYYQTPTENEQLFGARRKIHSIQICRRSGWLWSSTKLRRSPTECHQWKATKVNSGPGFRHLNADPGTYMIRMDEAAHEKQFKTRCA